MFWARKLNADKAQKHDICMMSVQIHAVYSRKSILWHKCSSTQAKKSSIMDLHIAPLRWNLQFLQYIAMLCTEKELSKRKLKTIIKTEKGSGFWSWIRMGILKTAWMGCKIRSVIYFLSLLTIWTTKRWVSTDGSHVPLNAPHNQKNVIQLFYGINCTFNQLISNFK